MLTPDQVLPFLLHDDHVVRRHALRYFEHANDVGALTADYLWQIIDRFGETERNAMAAVAMRGVQHTHASLQRLARGLAPFRTSKQFESLYQRVARDISFDVLDRHRDEVRAIPTLQRAVRAHLELRLSLADQPSNGLFDRLMDRGRELSGAYAGRFDASLPDALIEAIGRAAEPVVLDRALATLCDASARADWREIFAIRVLGEARHAAAVPALVDLYRVDADILRDEATNALGRIGTPDVIEPIVAMYPGQRWDVRLYSSAPLGRIKRPESETALMKLLEYELALSWGDVTESELGDDDSEEPDDPLIDQVLQALNELGSLAGRDVVARAIEADPDHPEVIEACEGLIASAVMAGVTLPEAAEWRKRIDGREVRPGFERAPPSVPGMVGAARSSQPKVGRNDPCPCGSGKKYKKCHGGAAT